MSLPKEVIEAKKAGQVMELASRSGDKYYFRSPGKKDLNLYKDLMKRGKVTKAVTAMLLNLAVYPDAESLKKRFAEKPGLEVALNNALLQTTDILK